MMWTRACSPTGRPIEICGVLLFLVCSPLAGPRRTVRGSSVNGKECWWSVSAWRTTQRTQASGTDRVCQTRRASPPQRLPPVTRSAPGTALRRARDCRLRVTSTLRPPPWSPPMPLFMRQLPTTRLEASVGRKTRAGECDVVPWDTQRRMGPGALAQEEDVELYGM